MLLLPPPLLPDTGGIAVARLLEVATAASASLRRGFLKAKLPLDEVGGLWWVCQWRWGGLGWVHELFFLGRVRLKELSYLLWVGVGLAPLAGIPPGTVPSLCPGTKQTPIWDHPIPSPTLPTKKHILSELSSLEQRRRTACHFIKKKNNT